MELSLALRGAAGPAPWSPRRSSSLELSSGRGTHTVSLRHFPWFLSLTRRTKQCLLGQTAFMDLKQTHQKVLAYHSNEAPILEARSIEEIYENLTERLLQTVETTQDSHSKYIVGLAGPPGAGKSTLASEVVQKLNKFWFQKASEKDSLVNSEDVAIVVPMDGFHLYRSQLDAMENPEEAHARRGAPWTFDPVLLLNCLQTLRNQGAVSVPSFDHGVGDPVEDDILVRQHHKVVIVEGNYLLLDEGVWKEISTIFDEKWFIEVNVNKAMERVLKRHICTGKPSDIAKWRVEHNDRPNAELIMTSKKNADVVIRSVDMNNLAKLE